MGVCKKTTTTKQREKICVLRVECELAKHFISFLLSFWKGLKKKEFCRKALHQQEMFTFEINHCAQLYAAHEVLVAHDHRSASVWPMQTDNSDIIKYGNSLTSHVLHYDTIKNNNGSWLNIRWWHSSFCMLVDGFSDRSSLAFFVVNGILCILTVKLMTVSLSTIKHNNHNSEVD